MAVSQAQKLASRKYRRNNYETVSFEVRKGIRDEYKQAAEKLGLSLAEFFKQAAESYGANHANEEFKPAPDKLSPDKLSPAERQLLDEFNALPDDVKKSFAKLIRQFNQNQPQN